MSVDLVTVELVERALRGLRDEMDAVVLRSAMSPIIREQHDEFPLVTNVDGLMLVGQFGSYVPLLLETFDESIDEGDIILQSDPYLCDGAIQHTPDWLVLVPIDYKGRRIGYTSMFGHMLDVGGAVPGRMAATAQSIWDEGLRIPPLQLFAGGELNTAVLKLILRNSTVPVMKSHVFTTTRDNQSAVKIRVMQGESDQAVQNDLLGEFVLNNIPPARKGEPEIEVAFDIDANGIVSVSARDLATHSEQSITVSARGTLSDDEIEKIMGEHAEYELPREK